MSKGMIFSIQQFSTEDGPGIRTSVFMKGCPLHCVWCHNPEGFSPRPDVMWHDVRCIGARECLRACPRDALALDGGGMQIDRTRCDACGLCAQACPAAAIEVIGREWQADDLMAELLKDRAFFETSGGGVTFSGGEPMQQYEFLAEVLPKCRSAGLQVALDTSGAVAWERFEMVLGQVDMVLLDLKLIDSHRHQLATGIGNELILENAQKLANAGMCLWVRTPIIPGWTDDEDNIRGLAEFIRENLPTLDRWDLLAYTNLGKPKYARLGLDYRLGAAPLVARTHMERLTQIALEIVPSARWSGATHE